MAVFWHIFANAVATKSIKNYLRKSCSALALKLLVKLTFGFILLAKKSFTRWVPGFPQPGALTSSRRGRNYNGRKNDGGPIFWHGAGRCRRRHVDCKLLLLLLLLLLPLVMIVMVVMVMAFRQVLGDVFEGPWP